MILVTVSRLLKFIIMNHTIEDLKNELLNILPYGSKVDDNVILDMPQFANEYLNEIWNRSDKDKTDEEKIIIGNAFRLVLDALKVNDITSFEQQK